MNFANKYIVRCAAAVSGAVCKFLTLYVGIVLVAVPMLLNLPEKQAAVVSGMFSVPQLFTALIGGGIAVIILPVLEKALASLKK
jgi:ABC-type Co2+ transport system permease subunit